MKHHKRDCFDNKLTIYTLPLGGCGACTVLVSRFDPASKTVKEVTANSCLLPLGNLHLQSVTTTEGLGSQKDGFHPVQKRLAGFHGSQCGFCTPGMVMSMYGKIKEKQRGGKSESGLCQGEVEAALQGNLCR
jgi:indole-3-acetaldehyde oxidase